MIGYHKSEEEHLNEVDFPVLYRWNPRKETLLAESRRVLEQLIRNGDNPNWMAFGLPSPSWLIKAFIPETVGYSAKVTCGYAKIRT